MRGLPYHIWAGGAAAVGWPRGVLLKLHRRSSACIRSRRFRWTAAAPYGEPADQGGGGRAGKEVRARLMSSKRLGRRGAAAEEPRESEQPHAASTTVKKRQLLDAKHLQRPVKLLDRMPQHNGKQLSSLHIP